MAAGLVVGHDAVPLSVTILLLRSIDAMSSLNVATRLASQISLFAKFGLPPVETSAAKAVVFANKSKGCGTVETKSPPFHVQFETTKLSKRRFSRGSCFSNSGCAFRASSRSRTPLLKVRLIGGLVPFDFAQATILLGTPLSRHPIEKGAIHLPIEFIDIHGVHAGLKPVVFGP